MWIYKGFSPSLNHLGARYPNQRVVSLKKMFLLFELMKGGCSDCQVFETRET